HPFLWGSKRTGPDLHRVGGKYPDAWHYQHMEDPTTMSPGSVMPPYTWLADNALNTSDTEAKMKTMRMLNVPYSDNDIENAQAAMRSQSEQISQRLEAEGIQGMQDKELVALIAYLQRLGKQPPQLLAGNP
ncbi:cbb3-type cytochrome c oxidase subunit II, partial [bacterium]|nr:cbb3-type cytochrome c oxidase subunit II [bacterium]